MKWQNSELKETDSKNRTYYCFNAMININDFILKKKDQKSYRDIFIHYFGYEKPDDAKEWIYWQW